MNPTLSIAKEFSRTPGSRYRTESTFSGEEFRETCLKPRFLQAVEKGTKLTVVLDGTSGYATSFLEEAFGGLAREYGSEKALKHIDIISTEEKYLKDDIVEYITKANA